MTDGQVSCYSLKTQIKLLLTYVNHIHFASCSVKGSLWEYWTFRSDIVRSLSYILRTFGLSHNFLDAQRFGFL